MKQQYLLALSVLAVVAISGCVGFEGLGFDLGFFESTKPQTFEAPPDIITVENLNVIPSSVPAESEFTVSFEVKHTGDPKESMEVSAVDVCLYNWGVCKPQATVVEGTGMVPAWPTGVMEKTLSKCTPADFEKYGYIEKDVTGKYGLQGEWVLLVISGVSAIHNTGFKQTTITPGQRPYYIVNQQAVGTRPEKDILENWNYRKEMVRIKCSKDGNVYWVTYNAKLEYPSGTTYTKKFEKDRYYFYKDSDMYNALNVLYEVLGQHETRKNFEWGSPEAVPLEGKHYIKPKENIELKLTRDQLNKINTYVATYFYGSQASKEALLLISSDCGSELKKFLPQQVEFVEWSLKAPTNDQIAGMRATCPIGFKVKYRFRAKSQVDINVISEERVKELQRAGQSVTITPTQTVGIGPLKIYFEFSQPQPFRTGSTVLMLITVEDKGSGLLEGNKITKITLKSSDPEMEIDGKCSPVNDITMVRKKSQQIRCTLTMPGKDKVPQSKTYYITASIDYQYSLDRKIEVPIIPTVTG